MMLRNVSTIGKEITYYRSGRTSLPSRAFNLQLQYSAPGIFSEGGTGTQAGQPFQFLVLRNLLAFWLILRGSQTASLTRVLISEPEYIQVRQARSLNCYQVRVLGVLAQSFINSDSLVSNQGSGMQILRSNLLLMAGSSSHGRLVAPRTSTRLPSFPTPSICTRNQVFTLRLDSFSPSPRLPVIESTSSMNITLDVYLLAVSKRVFTIFSASPTYLLMISLLLMLKNVLPSISDAQAFARKVLPVPGGPYSRIPFQGLREPVKIQGNLKGMITAYLRASFALNNPATSSHLTSGFSRTIASPILLLRLSLSVLASLLLSTFLDQFIWPQLFLTYSPIFLISPAKSSKVYLKAI